MEKEFWKEKAKELLEILEAVNRFSQRRFGVEIPHKTLIELGEECRFTALAGYFWALTFNQEDTDAREIFEKMVEWVKMVDERWLTTIQNLAIALKKSNAEELRKPPHQAVEEIVYTRLAPQTHRYFYQSLLALKNLYVL